mmetsp:Transcript_5313/g.8217  ORF Transcript_5313/g.8217 Transcript_5313/m.8217 type:complete len:146 (-) Transcript_5313:1354-1791(-)|eukprot:CAMPEP_0184667820 /NCGR_PEP_ID=MMETSP0308-20130426/69315_1 /TAXON_ID=38269 /ORGANISM="Gloeochaete witrockiana, Strain SAG 46.84" /LENGTH=145 /DNA_ID=CAMNT_0027113221 /DNA_START=120 /DNA_END=557 /DNA_ORIENTATION=+
MEDDIIAIVRSLSVTVDSLRTKRPRNEFCSNFEEPDEELERAWKRAPVLANSYARSKNPLATELCYFMEYDDDEDETLFFESPLDPSPHEIGAISVVMSETPDAQSARQFLDDKYSSQDSIIGCFRESKFSLRTLARELFVPEAK